jgi:hypothetical protein
MRPETTPAPSTGSKGTLQRDAARARGNEFRLERATQRKYVSSIDEQFGRAAVGRLIVSCPPWLASARVYDVIKWVRNIYRSEIDRIIALATITHGDRRVREITQRQRILISLALRGRLTAQEAKALTEAPDMIAALERLLEAQKAAGNGR